MSAEYVMVGGFLGAGKTTALLRLADHFTSQGRRVGLITNDQSQGLVDTSMVNAKGYPVEEITGGCFCCRFNSLTDAADRLTRDARPDVFLAEPVGSCTDLRATVQYPLRRLYGDDYRVAPLSVLVDPAACEACAGARSGPAVLAQGSVHLREAARRSGHHRHQQERPASAPEQRQALESALEGAVPSRRRRDGERADWRRPRWVVRSPVRTARDRDPPWTSTTTCTRKAKRLLGWLNATVQLSSPKPFDGNAFIRRLATDVQQRLASDGIEIAHFKMTLAPDSGHDLAVLNLVRTDTLAGRAPPAR